MIVTKNRNRGVFEFANINLLGKCNANCFFCLGRDIPNLLNHHNQVNVHFTDWRNWGAFLDKCKQENIKKLYITGQNTDALVYRYTDELIDFLHSEGFLVGIRTNGYKAMEQMDTCNKCTCSVGYSIHSLDPETNFNMIGRRTIPDWDTILRQTKLSRVAIVICRQNVDEFDDILKFLGNYPNIKYVQVRRISTDTRLELLAPEIVAYEKLFRRIHEEYEQTGTFHLAQQYIIYGKQINFWRTVETDINSMNYFTDGTISDEYFVVEGYQKNYKKS